MDERDYQYYGVYADLLEQTKEQVMEDVAAMLERMSKENLHSPAEHILSRIKRADSMQEKLAQKGHKTDALTALLKTSDYIGIRIVTRFVGDSYKVLDYIKEDSSWKVVEIKDYISNPKPNGYRSLHVIVEVPVETELGFETLQVEIQLRTIAMDCWASLEHQLKYKKDVPNADLLLNELRRCADEIASTDLSMQTIREMIQENEE